VRIIGNPVVLRALVALMCAAFALVVGLLCIRLVRKTITEEGEIAGETNRSLDTLPMHVYNTVIQQLKQQKHELQVQSQAEQQRARTSETISQAVLSNLSSGVLVFGANGLVKSANPAARAILGFASPAGMSVEDIFRGAMVRSEGAAGKTASEELLEGPAYLTDEIHTVLREGSKERQLEANYETPANEQRVVALTISPVLAQDGELLGVACLIHDRGEVESIRRELEVRGESSAEMALRLRTSLSTISGYAQQMASNRDPKVAQQLAKEIADEAVQLDRSLGGFLTSESSGKLTATGVGT
jgi:two-component system, OmpR family, phosphate regulon sensor histidine kinase PhoR